MLGEEDGVAQQNGAAPGSIIRGYDLLRYRDARRQGRSGR